MEKIGFCVLVICFATICLVPCVTLIALFAIKIPNLRFLRCCRNISPLQSCKKHSLKNSNTKFPRKLHSFKKFYTYKPFDSSNADLYVSSPFSLPPYESLPPFPLPENAPPYCVYPPSTIPSPTGGYTPLPPPGSAVPTLPGPTPIPPNPPTIVPSPPTEPVFSPPQSTPPPSGLVPSPRFLPPIVFPPPTVPPPPYHAPATAMWCVAKASVPGHIIQEAMNYACGSGADCDPIQPNGSCFEPDTLLAHASYAFNSYWQRTKVGGGSCDFGRIAILVEVDPSYDGCHFIYY